MAVGGAEAKHDAPIWAIHRHGRFARWLPATRPIGRLARYAMNICQAPGTKVRIPRQLEFSSAGCKSPRADEFKSPGFLAEGARPGRRLDQLRLRAGGALSRRLC